MHTTTRALSNSKGIRIDTSIQVKKSFMFDINHLVEYFIEKSDEYSK